MTKKNKIAGLLIIIGITVAGIAWIYLRDPVVARVGDYSITQSDVDFRNQIYQFYTPGDNRKPGLQQLTKALTYAQILKNNGQPVDEATILEEEKRIDSKTLMPEKLQALKALFKGNMKSYRKVFVLPTYVERVIYFEFFLKSPKVQSEEQKKALAFLRESMTEKGKFELLAKKEGLPIKTLLISESEGVRFYDSGKTPLEDNPQPGGGAQPKGMPDRVSEEMNQRMAEFKKIEYEKWAKDVLEVLKIGQIFPQLVEFGEQWGVVKLIQKPKNKKQDYRLKAVTFPKADYEQWLKTETSKVNISER